MSKDNKKKPKGLISEYEVGYGKPPTSTRFKKGQSGNRKGRPKGSKNFATDLETVLNSKLTVTENGKPKKVTTQMAALQRLKQKGLGGETKALAKLLDLAKQNSETRDTNKQVHSLSKDDADLLQRLVDECRIEEPAVEMDGDMKSDNDGGDSDDET